METLDYFESGNRVKIICGPESLRKIQDLLQRVNSSRPMLITDANVKASGLVDLVLQNLGSDICADPIAEDVPPNSSVMEVHRLARIFTRTGCDSILAVGGGSVIDTAKGVNLAVTEAVDDVTRLSGIGALMHPLLPLIAVPTTAGSGSETTGSAVIADSVEHRKWFFFSPFIAPMAAVIDPDMTLTLSPEATAAGAVNALAHAMEACLSLARNPIANAQAVSAIRLIKANLFDVMRSPKDRSGRTALSLASCLAGLAISGSMAGTTYALGHGLSALCKIPHSLCTAILLPYSLAYNLQKIRPIADTLLLHLAGATRYTQTPRHLRAEQLMTVVREMNQALSRLTAGKYATCLAELNPSEGPPKIPRDLLNDVATAAYNNSTLFFDSEKIEKSELLCILELAWEGRQMGKKIKSGKEL